MNSCTLEQLVDGGSITVDGLVTFSGFDAFAGLSNISVVPYDWENNSGVITGVGLHFFPTNPAINPWKTTTATCATLPSTPAGCRQTMDVIDYTATAINPGDKLSAGLVAATFDQKFSESFLNGAEVTLAVSAGAQHLTAQASCWNISVLDCSKQTDLQGGNLSPTAGTVAVSDNIATYLYPTFNAFGTPDFAAVTDIKNLFLLDPLVVAAIANDATGPHSTFSDGTVYYPDPEPASMALFAGALAMLTRLRSRKTARAS